MKATLATSDSGTIAGSGARLSTTQPSRSPTKTPARVAAPPSKVVKVPARTTALASRTAATTIVLVTAMPQLSQAGSSTAGSSEMLPPGNRTGKAARAAPAAT